ncbi:hypothetical protein FXF51_24680 [Nonomuraea sp. PA05]|uniref:hypothetical protein n=1 Tax=Nonomuraea sp. PA05 TaxID=2604466 RepID=UPI0011D5CEDA|nr:hypothetical protein [Nonomuraea sp. PA05]TYB62639.1 hypothetical protein FXF51_24680 [Nonomuraea sp. PA05]
MTAIARQLAEAHQEQDPRNLRYIVSTRQAALAATTPSRPVGDASVYVIQMEGSFERRLRHREEPLRGRFMMILVDAETGQVTDWSISAQPFDLSELGQALPL